MPTTADRDKVDYIIELIELIHAELEGYPRDKFLATRRVYDLAAYRLGTIGETAHRLSETLKSSHPDMPWRSIYAFRNIVAHDYRSMDPERVWVIVTEDIGPLEAACRSLQGALEHE